MGGSENFRYIFFCIRPPLQVLVNGPLVKTLIDTLLAIDVSTIYVWNFVYSFSSCWRDDKSR